MKRFLCLSAAVLSQAGQSASWAADSVSPAILAELAEHRAYYFGAGKGLFNECAGVPEAEARMAFAVPEAEARMAFAVPDPDTVSSGLPGVWSMSEVLTYGGKTTDRDRNHGIVSYMRDSIVSEDHFFEDAFRFYSRLRKYDMGRIEERTKTTIVPFEEAPIQLSADPFDALDLAVDAADGDRYLALKILALYGHDNHANRLAEASKDGSTRAKGCRFAALDATRTMQNSVLFLNGAIPELRYSLSRVEAGQRIAKFCNEDGMTREERKLCNDAKDDYQGDYYHVIAAAFLGCRDALRDRGRLGGVAGGSSMDALGALAQATGYAAGVERESDLAYMLAARTYKLARFGEEAREAKVTEEFRAVLNAGLDRIGERGYVDVEALASRLPPRQARAASAILDRYEFETRFRMEQHLAGRRWGRAYCAH